MQKKISVFWTIIICLIVMLVTFNVTFLVMTEVRRSSEAELAQKYDENLSKLEQEYLAKYASINELYSALPEEQRSSELFMRLAYIDTYYRTLYVGEIDEERLNYYLMHGYIAGTGDKYGEFYTIDDLKSIFQQANGKLYGIGVTVIYNAEYSGIEILTVSQNGPADKVGIIPGDIITKVNGERVSLENYYEMINNVKGDKGTSVSLTYLRSGVESTVSAIRDEITITTVTHSKYVNDSSIGFIRVSEFNGETPKQIKVAVEALIGDGAKSIVFDMRNNPGGTLEGVIESLDYLLPEGDLCYVVGADGKVSQTFKSKASCLDPSIKLAVLINENTASAAELFTSALRDYQRATIVGVKSYGKGSMQTTYMLPNGEGLKLSTNTYNPPCNQNYDGIGITPNIIVELDESLKNKSFYKITQEEDNQLLEACYALGYTNK
ncbi:MAG: PDZ domain-containing protein [Clostridia bacterium]|nr:PDZ domain-containing protein [Clostridia bacterium]